MAPPREREEEEEDEEREDGSSESEQGEEQGSGEGEEQGSEEGEEQGSEESESESDDDEDAPQQAKPSAAAHATPSDQSESEASLHSHKPSQSSSLQQPANLAKRLASPQIQTPEPKKKKKKGLDPENENGGGAKMNKQPFSRVWSEEEEILILKTMADHPLYDTKSLYEIIKPHLHGDFTQLQFQEKVKKMKKKCLARLNNGQARMSSKPHDISCFQLSKRVWGDKREVSGTAGDIDAGVSEEIIMSYWQLVEEPVKREWEERFKKAYTRILILKQERAKLALEAAKSNRN